MSTCPNPEVLLTYFDRHFDPVESAQLNYGPIGVVYEEERDANGKLVQKPTPEGMTADEFRLQNAPMGIMCLTEYEWDNYVNMEPRAQLRLERLEKYANPYNPDNVQRIPTLSYSLEEINVLAPVRDQCAFLYHAESDEMAVKRRRERCGFCRIRHKTERNRFAESSRMLSVGVRALS